VRCLTTLGIGSCACDVKSDDGFEVSSWTYGDLFFAVQDAQMGVFDDDGDDLAAVTGAELDVLAATMMRPLAWTFRCARSDPGGSGGGGHGVDGVRAPVSRPS
jgi:hypothetical protein